MSSKEKQNRATQVTISRSCKFNQRKSTQIYLKHEYNKNVSYH